MHSEELESSETSHSDQLAPQPVVHVFEGKELGHGPLWLGYLVQALNKCARRIIVSYPDLPSYEAFASNWRDSARVDLRPFAYPLEAPRYRNALELGRQVEADVTLITFLDVFGLYEYEDLLRQFPGKLMGLWFLAPREVVVHPLRRLFSRKLRKAHALVRNFQEPPEVLKHIFVLDESIAQLIGVRADLGVSILPDPWHCSRMDISKTEARSRLGIPSDKKVFLHFGSTDTRKGIEDVLAVWEQNMIPSYALLVRAGCTREYQSARLLSLAEQGRALLFDRYLSDAELDDFLSAADWVLLPYRDHFGSSGALAGAAAARRPVICSDGSILGRRVREGRLGITYETKSVDGLSVAVSEACAGSRSEFTENLALYSQQHTVARFIDIIRQAF